MNYWKVILATVVIFGAGVFTGGLLVNHINHPHFKGPRHLPANGLARTGTNNAAAPGSAEVPLPRIAREMGKQFAQQLNDRLQLTPAQLGKIEKIIAAGQERNHELWTNVSPKIRAVIQEVNQQIRVELTPEQLVQFEKILKRPPRRSPGTNAPAALRPATNLPPAAPGA